ncbi:GH116 family glycosyl-hydrolase [Pontiellaceae bacterium B12227]|nr:GH116 family glycosyl-hydrolase [Pontiellaceae bacterium B12227]
MKYMKARMLALLATVVIGLGSLQARADTVRFDFESGDLQGWKIYSGAFGEKLISDKPEFWNSGGAYNKQGTYHLSTLETDGSKPKDSLAGVILSPVFELHGPNISFLIGGGSHEDTYVALCSEDGQILKAVGQNKQTMQSVVWNAPELVGKKAILVVVDENKGGWGHITLDDFQAEGRIVPAEDSSRIYNAYQQKVQERYVSLKAERKAVRAKRLAGLPEQDFFLKGNPALHAYWRFDGDLSDTLGGYPADGPADLEFVKGAVEGQALRLKPGQHVKVPNGLPIGHNAASLELFFRLNAMPDGTTDPVIISQASETSMNFVVGVKRDLSALTYTHNGRVKTVINLPTGKPVEIGRWYHLVVMSEHLDLRIYMDGHECALSGGAFHFQYHKDAKGLAPLTFGAIAKKDHRAASLDIDEIAYYEVGLSIDEIRSHLMEAGWGARLEEVGREAGQYMAGLNQARDKRQQELLNDPALTARGETKVYENETLEAILFTVGGIGAGGVQFNGSAEPEIWQIACQTSERRNPEAFMAVRVQPEGGQPVVRALQTKPVGPFAAMSSLRFTGEYPFASYRFNEPELPVKMELEVFNPFTPMDARSSAIPCVIYTVKATNPSSVSVRVDILAAQKNLVGYNTGMRGSQETFGQNQNKVLQDGDATLLHMTQEGSGQDMVLMTQAPGASGQAAWTSRESLYDAFSSGGELAGAATSAPSPVKQTLSGALSAPLELAPGESKSVTYVLTWYMPKEVHGNSESWQHRGNMYENWWSDATDVADYLRKNLDDLTARSRRYHRALYDSNLPVWLLDRLSSQLAILKSQTCWWAADGYFGCYEGAGSCEGNCTHVWHYAQAHARLFPELGRKMREEDFAQMAPDGRILMRHSHPNSNAADGHLGTLLNAYREHLCSVDNTWLNEQWPHIEKAIDFAMNKWDPNKDGFMSGRQDNTLDGHLFGCTSWMGSMYLTALEAVARMAEIQNDPPLAEALRGIRASGKKLQNERLWNGEYYIQTRGKQRSGDYLDGCSIDQLLGEWWGEQLGIDPNYPLDRRAQAMVSLLKYNFCANFHGMSLTPRQFATLDDAGLKILTWPQGPQPVPSTRYADEVMTGFEYGAGVSMIQNGMQREGLMVIKAIYDRYDGRLRTEGITLGGGAQGYTGNPFADDECGKFYSRSLSVWSALLALQGFDYDGPAGRIGFAPRWQPEDHASFFTVAEGYGLFTQELKNQQLNASIDLREGQLRLTEVELALPAGMKPITVKVKSGGQAVGLRFEVKDEKLLILFKHPLVLKAGQKLDVQMAY